MSEASEEEPDEDRSKGDQPKKYTNLRAQHWWEARNAFREREYELSQLDDVTLNELTFPKWKLQNCKILIEPTEDIRKRLGRSPDNASSALLAMTESEPAHEVTQRKTKDTRRRRPR
ncbi:hypothetical protein SAMN06893096_103477 [Geodermatophilus pulveris]|uniref:Uncharacterized protein n=1 Tax=Geodermatophilus pulveris TaxID=1564159 RepID=A0A239E3I4_9ACTN|nr:hypothetical protein [Geodermatophilus pulveris]SNS38434.1 hypothetical protein SAMN06893096_103477 [Geodermatophilus pulveris]